MNIIFFSILLKRLVTCKLRMVTPYLEDPFSESINKVISLNTLFSHIKLLFKMTNGVCTSFYISNNLCFVLFNRKEDKDYIISNLFLYPKELNIILIKHLSLILFICFKQTFKLYLFVFYNVVMIIFIDFILLITFGVPQTCRNKH